LKSDDNREENSTRRPSKRKRITSQKALAALEELKISAAQDELKGCFGVNTGFIDIDNLDSIAQSASVTRCKAQRQDVQDLLFKWNETGHLIIAGKAAWRRHASRNRLGLKHSHLISIE